MHPLETLHERVLLCFMLRLLTWATSWATFPSPVSQSRGHQVVHCVLLKTQTIDQTINQTID
jgi:hypothetical protein